jgi:hypothetical protein
MMNNKSVCPVFRLIDKLNGKFKLDLICEFYECPGNVFDKKLNWKRQHTKYSRAMLNCIYFGSEAVGSMNTEDIAKLYGISRQRVEQILDSILFGRKGLGRYIINNPSLRKYLDIKKEQLEHFNAHFDRVEGARQQKEIRSSLRRKKKCIASSMRHSGRIQKSKN